MILDNMKNHTLYHSIHPKLGAAFAFIEKAVAEELPVDKYELDGKALYAFIQEYTTKLPQDGKLEGHRNYIDIQYIVSGKERIDLVDIAKAQEKTPYDPVKDVRFYQEDSIAGTYRLEAGDYGIFFPQDLHKPGLQAEGVSESVKKIVVKIAV